MISFTLFMVIVSFLSKSSLGKKSRLLVKDGKTACLSGGVRDGAFTFVNGKQNRDIWYKLYGGQLNLFFAEYTTETKSKICLLVETVDSSTYKWPGSGLITWPFTHYTDRIWSPDGKYSLGWLNMGFINEGSEMSSNEKNAFMDQSDNKRYFYYTKDNEPNLGQAVSIARPDLEGSYLRPYQLRGDENNDCRLEWDADRQKFYLRDNYFYYPQGAPQYVYGYNAKFDCNPNGDTFTFETV